MCIFYANHSTISKMERVAQNIGVVVCKMEKTTDKGEQMTLPKGYKRTEIGILPSDWEVVRLGEVCDVRDGTHESPKPTNEGKILITSKNLKGGKIDFSDSYHISLEDFEAINKRSRVEKYDTLMSMIGTVGEVAFVDIEPNFAIKNVALFKMDGNEKFSKFLFFFFQSSVGKKRILSFLSGSTQKYITLDFLRNLQIPLPPIAEQEKIARVLSTWDTQIQNLESLIAEKQTLKKGLCQILLTAKTRFRGFSEDWQVVRLGEVANIVMGASPKSEFYNQDFIGLPLIQGKNDTLEKQSFTTTYTQKSVRECQEGDILMSVRAPIGFLFWASERSSIGRGVCAIQAKQNQNFLFYILDFLEKKWEKIGQGSTFTAINKNDILDFDLAIPSIAEQEKIAEILSEADNEITLLEQKLESLKSQKKGLMQKLLKGKVRVG